MKRSGAPISLEGYRRAKNPPVAFPLVPDPENASLPWKLTYWLERLVDQKVAAAIREHEEREHC